MERELRVAARQPRIYRSRLATAGAVLVLGATIIWTFSQFGSMLMTGKEIFVGLSYVALVVCGLGGATATADCLSGEKREGTLGLLFLTDLKGRDVVLGKLLANSLTSFYGLLAAFPIFAIVFVLGGVKAGEFWRVMLNLIATLFFSLSAGLFASAISRQQRRATNVAGLLMFIFLFGLPGLSEWLRRNYDTPELAFTLHFLSPSYSQTMAFETSSALRQNYFWWSLLKTILLAAGFLTLASWLLPRSWQDRALQPKALRWWAIRQRMNSSTGRSARAGRARGLDKNPFYWLAGRLGLSAVSLWGLIGLAIAFVGWFWWRYGESARDSAMAASFVGAGMLTFILIVSIVSAACQRLAEDRHSGALELLLATPISVQTILSGQWFALFRQFIGPTIAILFLDSVVVWLTAFVGETGANQWESLKYFLMFFGCLIADLITLVWLGMWMALRVKQANQASAAAFWRVLVLPWPIGGLILGLLNWMKLLHLPHIVPCVWIGTILVNNLAWSLWARRKLYREFRTAATDRYQPPREPRRWWRLFRELTPPERVLPHLSKVSK